LNLKATFESRSSDFSFTLTSWRFQHGCDRVNLHRPTFATAIVAVVLTELATPPLRHPLVSLLAVIAPAAAAAAAVAVKARVDLRQDGRGAVHGTPHHDPAQRPASRARQIMLATSTNAC
jgi:hypothetical protein